MVDYNRCIIDGSSMRPGVLPRVARALRCDSAADRGLRPERRVRAVEHSSSAHTATSTSPHREHAQICSGTLGRSASSPVIYVAHVPQTRGLVLLLILNARLPPLGLRLRTPRGSAGRRAFAAAGCGARESSSEHKGWLRMPLPRLRLAQGLREVTNAQCPHCRPCTLQLRNHKRNRR